MKENNCIIRESSIKRVHVNTTYKSCVFSIYKTKEKNIRKLLIRLRQTHVNK